MTIPAVMKGKEEAIGARSSGLFDLTNQSTVTIWTTRLTVTDVVWRTLLVAAGYAAVRSVLSCLRRRIRP